SVAVAGPPGTNNYYRISVDGIFYQPIVEDLVVSFGGSGGLVQTFHHSQLLINNAFFVGGDNLRGFAVGGIGPRDANTTDALGGTYFYTGTTELSFPLGLPKEIGILGKAFVDV